MKHFKGRISIFLALVLMCSTAVWAETQPSPSMTFRSEDKVNWLVSAESLVEKDETIRYEDAAMSVKWTPNVGAVAAIRIQNLAEKGMVTDWTDYNMLKLRIYSDVATGNTLLARPIYTADTWGGIYWEPPAITVDWTGWKEISIPFSEFTPKGDIGGWSSIQGFGIFATNTEATAGSLYLDEIWLENIPPSSRITLRTEDKADWFLAQNSKIAKDETVGYSGAAMSMKWELTQGKVGELRLQYLKDKNITTDWTPYDVLKLRIYSDQANGNHVLVRAMSTADGFNEKQEDGSTIQKYYEQAFDINWTGWKEIAIPLNTFVSNNMTGWNSIQSIGLFETNMGGGSLYFDEIWLEETPLSSSIPLRSENTTSWFVTRNGSVAADETVKYGDATMSIRWDLTPGQVAELRLQYLEDKNIVTDWTPYDTLKLRVYSPEANGNHVLIRALATEDGYNEKQSDGTSIPKYYEQAFDVDWTGWREIAIPLNTFVSHNMTDWNSIQSIGLFETNMGGGALHFDEIWLENHKDRIVITQPQTVKEDSVVTVSSTVSNLVQSEGKLFPVTLIAAAYQNDRLVQVSFQSEEIKAGMLEQAISITLENIPADAEIKTFVWNGFDRIAPYSLEQ